MFNANQSLKRKVQVTMDVAASLADMVVLLHGGNFSSAYITKYNVIRPHVSPGHLRTEDQEVLGKILGDFSGKELTLDHQRKLSWPTTQATLMAGSKNVMPEYQCKSLWCRC